MAQFILLRFCVLLLFMQAAFSGDMDNRLVGLKTIYLQNKGGSTRLISFLSTELSRKGYIVAVDPSQADAILKGWGAIVEINLDDRPPSERLRIEPDIYKFKYELVSNKNQKIWETAGIIKIYSDPQGADRKAAITVIKELDKAIKSAVRKWPSKQ